MVRHIDTSTQRSACISTRSAASARLVRGCLCGGRPSAAAGRGAADGGGRGALGTVTKPAGKSALEDLAELTYGLPAAAADVGEGIALRCSASRMCAQRVAVITCKQAASKECEQACASHTVPGYSMRRISIMSMYVAPMQAAILCSCGYAAALSRALTRDSRIPCLPA